MVQFSVHFLLQTARPVIQEAEMADQMASDLDKVDFNSLETEAMFTSYDGMNKSSDNDKEGLSIVLLKLLLKQKQYALKRLFLSSFRKVALFTGEARTD